MHLGCLLMVIDQYSNFFSLYIYIGMLIPAIILGLFGKKIKWYGMLVSIPALILIFGLNSKQMFQFLGFIVVETFLVFLYFYINKRTKSKAAYYIIFAASFIPIILVKFCIYTPYNFLGFLGISYISFRVWQMFIEIHDGHIDKLSLPVLLYFFTFFPTITSGPIDRYKRFTEDLEAKHTTKEYTSEFLTEGLKRICIGIFYKFVVAFIINRYILDNIPDNKTFISVIIYMYAYTIYLFFDFAGYSSFAIGTGYLLGIHVPQNFDKPFLAHNMKEFWDRWHMSLSKWFGDYLFSRFILNTMRSGKIKSKKTAIRLGYLLTMIVMGVWHGPYLFYILYGLYQGIMLILTDIYIKSSTYRKFKKSKLYNVISRVCCFQAVAFGMLLFSGYLITI